MKATSNSTSRKLAKGELSSVEGYAAGKKLASEFMDHIRKCDEESIEMKAIDALERLRDIARGPVSVPVHQGFCEGIMESGASGGVKTADAPPERSTKKQSLAYPKVGTPLDLEDEINRRTAQASAICMLAGGADGEYPDTTLPLAMWCVECLLNDVGDLVHRLAFPEKSPNVGSAE